MAVLEAVRGWEALAGLPRLGEEASEEEGTDEVKKEEEAAPEWSEEELENLLKTDYESLLFEHDEHVASPPPGSIRKSADQ